MEPKFKVGDRVRISDERYLISNRGPQEYQIEDMKLLGGHSEWQYGCDWVTGIRESDLELVTPATPEFSEGDLVEAVKGEILVRGRIRKRDVGGDVIEDLGFVSDFMDDGFTVSLVEAAKAVLPTEPGWYIDRDNVPWRLSRVGHWHAAPKGSEPLALWEAELLIQGTTRLVPEVKNA